MKHCILWICAWWIANIAWGAESPPKPPEFGEAVDAVTASLALSNNKDEGNWVFLVTLKNSDTKKNRALMFGDRASGWQWELAGPGLSTSAKGELSTRVPPGNTKALYLPPGAVRTVKITGQDVNGTPSPYELPPGVYRLRLSFLMFPSGENEGRQLFTNWIDFTLEAEGQGSDAAHREYPHISEGIGARLSVPKKPAEPYAFDVTLRNFAETPLRLFLLSATGFRFEFRPVGKKDIVYAAVADYDQPAGKLPPALLAMRDKNFRNKLRASIDMSGIQSKGTRDFHLEVFRPYTAGAFQGKWKLTRTTSHSTENLDSIPAGKYRVRAFYDPATLLDTVVAFVPLNEFTWRGVAVSNAIEINLPLKATEQKSH